MACELTNSDVIRIDNICVGGSSGNTITLHQGNEWVKENKAQKITIKEKDNGYIVNVGCKEFVFETSSNLLKYLRMYLNNPNRVEKKFNDNKLFK